MISRSAISAAVLLLGLLQGAGAQENAASRFIGAWTGVQRWNQSNPPPGSEPQNVTFSLTETDGQLIGKVTPFLGGNDGAILTGIRISGKQLRADGILGEAQSAQDQGDTSPFWKNDLKITFTFSETGDGKITGNANLTLGGVQWLKYQYTLAREGTRP